MWLRKELGQPIGHDFRWYFDIFFLGGGLFKDTTVSATLSAGGQLSVPYFEKGWSEKNKCLGGLKEFCHGYLPGGLTMFLVKKKYF